MKTLILNDIHLGAVRSAGTTMQSRKALMDYLQQSFRRTVLDHREGDLILGGDVFDSFNVEVSEVLKCYFTLADWLGENEYVLHLDQGNHDIAKNSEKTSSFAFLAALLTKLCPERVRVYTTGLDVMCEAGGKPVYVIPHVVNQDLFDLELAKAREVPPGYILLHANYDNCFAEQADHSLNVSAEQVGKLVANGHQLIFAHEHQAKTDHHGRVTVMGNQWPSSVADCLPHGVAQIDGRKYAHYLTDAGLVKVETWSREGDYLEVDWKALEATDTAARFIRVTGQATTDEASSVIATIARYRQHSDALVITNACRIDGIDGLDDMHTLSGECLASVDVMAALMEELTAPEQAKVTWLLED